MGLRDSIRTFVAAAKLELLPVPTPELPQHDGQIFVTRISGRMLASLRDNEDTDERTALVVMAACDSEGSRIFEMPDVAWLVGQAYLQPFIERAYAAALHVNGLTRENRESWRKNSEGTAHVGSPTS